MPRKQLHSMGKQQLCRGRATRAARGLQDFGQRARPRWHPGAHPQNQSKLVAMVFTPITGLGGRVVVPRAGRSTPTRATSSVSASHGGHGGGNNGLRRTGGNGGDSGGRARLVLSGASLVGSLLLGASPAAAAPKKGGKNSKLALPELTNVDLAVRVRCPLSSGCVAREPRVLTARQPPG